MELEKLIERSRRIVFFGGAGVSTASGIPDFRSADGLYNAGTGLDGERRGPSPEDILSATYFALHTKEFYDFYRKHMVYPDAKPNACHRYLYKLEKQDENYCVQCETEYPLDKIMETDSVPRCDKCGGIIKPWVVLYGEAPDKYTMIGACREISGADLLIVAGTSLSVEPAASLIGYFSGRDLVVINKEATPADEKASLVIRDDVESVFKTLMEK